MNRPSEYLRAPFPYFGSKARVAGLIWQRFGRVANYVEPFGGSAAVLLARPDWQPGMTETYNDADGLLVNAYRAIRFDPLTTARYAAWPISECCLHARHAWLVGRREDITARLMGDPEWYDSKAAGWWLWGIGAWIGHGWCAGLGPWQSVDGVLVDTATAGNGVWRKLPHLGNRGQGIHRQLPHLGDRGRGIHRQLPRLAANGSTSGAGIHHPANLKPGHEAALRAWFAMLAARLEGVRITCGDWRRVLGPSPTVHLGTTAVFLDPPYGVAEREDCYSHDSRHVANEVREWAIAHGEDPRLRIALAGYDTEHAMPARWTAHRWKAHGGYANQGNGQGRVNAGRECLWFSPHCLPERHVQQAFAWETAGEPVEVEAAP